MLIAITNDSTLQSAGQRPT